MKYGWTTKSRSFEEYYKKQLLKLRNKLAPVGDVSDLNEINSLEDISYELDKCIDSIGK